MASLLESSELFEASAKLARAAIYLRNLAEGNEVDVKARTMLAWVGQLLERVDWRNENWSRSNVSGDLAIQATSIRPKFYEILLGNDSTKAQRMSSELPARLLHLSSGTGETSGLTGDERQELRDAAVFLEEVSRGLLLEVVSHVQPSDPPLFAVGM